MHGNVWLSSVCMCVHRWMTASLSSVQLSHVVLAWHCRQGTTAACYPTENWLMLSTPHLLCNSSLWLLYNWDTWVLYISIHTGVGKHFNFIFQAWEFIYYLRAQWCAFSNINVRILLKKWRFLESFYSHFETNHLFTLYSLSFFQM